MNKSEKVFVKEIDLHGENPLEMVKLAKAVSAALRKLDKPSSKAKLSRSQHTAITRAVYAASDACKAANHGR
jgi:hypothetical protein